MSNKFYIRAGIDDIETGTRKCFGWTYFFLPAIYVADFENEAKAILTGSKLHSFHGKKFIPDQIEEYKSFLSLIRKYTEVSFQTLSVTTLIASHQKESLEQKGNDVLEKYLKVESAYTNEIINILLPYVSPLLTLADVTAGLGPNIVATVDMDQSSKFSSLNKLLAKSDGETTGQALLHNMYNTYCMQNYERTPTLAVDGIQVKQDTKSFLIQAADVFGNFSMAYTFNKLGNSSKRRKLKADIINDVFSDRMNMIDFSQYVTFEGDDLILSADKKSITIRSGWSVVNGT